MRWLALLLLCAPALADPVRQAADDVLKGNDVAALAKRDDPDPWLVADELCARGEHDAALTFAKAAPRKDVEKLPAYVAARRGAPDRAAARRAVREAWSMKDPKAALALLDRVDVSPADVVSVRACLGRGNMLRRMKRPRESEQAYVAGAQLAERIGWLRAAADAYGAAIGSALRRSDSAAALASLERVAKLEEARGNRPAVARAVGTIGIVHFRRGELDKSLDHLERARRLFAELGDRAAVALTHFNVAAIYKRKVDVDKAIDSYKRALEIREESGDRVGAARCLWKIAEILRLRGNYEQALPYQERELRLQEQLGDRAGIGRALTQLGIIQKARGELDAALACHERALKIREALGDRAGVAGTLINLGFVHDLRGDTARALGFFERGLEAAEAARHRPWVANALGGLSDVHAALGDLTKALAYAERERKLKTELNDRAGIAGSLARLGTIHLSRGEYARAQELIEQALEMQERRPAIASTLSKLGSVRFRLGDYAGARADLERAKRLQEEMGKPLGVTHVLIKLGMLAAARGDDSAAAAHFRQSRDLAQRHGYEPGVAAALAGLGSVRRDREHLEKAYELYTRLRYRLQAASVLGDLAMLHSSRGELRSALARAQQSRAEMEALGHRGGLATALLREGEIRANLGQVARALVCYERAREIHEKTGARSELAGTLVSLGGLHDRLGSHDAARSCLLRALALSEETGDRPRQLAALTNLASNDYRGGDVAGACTRLERALLLAEKMGRRRSIAAIVGNLGLFRRRLGDLDAALACQQRALAIARELGNAQGTAIGLENLGLVLADRGDFAEAQARLGEAVALAEEIGAADVAASALGGLARLHLKRERPADAIAAARRGIEKLPLLVGRLAEQEGAQARETWSSLFAIGADAAWALGDPAEAFFFLESGRAGALLESLGGRDALGGAALPDELRTREAAVKTARAELLRATSSRKRKRIRAARATLVAEEKRLLKIVARIQRTAKTAADVRYPQAAELADVRAGLADDEALVLYAYVARDARALVATREGARLVTLCPNDAIAPGFNQLVKVATGKPAAEALAELRTLLVERLGLDARTKRILISPAGQLAYVPFALLAGEREVVYVPSGTTHALLRAGAAGRGDGVLALGDPDYTGTKLSALPGTRAEAKAVGDVLLLGKDATARGLREAAAKRPRWRAIHLACHGIVDAGRPLLSSLALHKSSLTTLEVFHARFPADLVVLSACETAWGKVYRSEGVVGFTRAFMIAGTPRVIVSLWKVDDEATKALMVKFYELWSPSAKATEDKHPQPAATALKNAQKHVASQEKWRHPYYWAAWQLWGLPE